MAELTLSIMNRPVDIESLLHPVVEAFQKKHDMALKIQVMDWATARADLNRIAFNHQGPDISEIGTTWLADMIAMNSLRPFEPGELPPVNSFAASSWRTCQIEGNARYWAAPWFSDAFVIHYRKDLLERVNLSPEQAFASVESLDAAAAALAAAGMDIPVALPLQFDRYGMLHCLASFVWASGGDFCIPNPDGSSRSVAVFDRPEAIAGCQAYFKLLKRLSPAGRRACANENSHQLFHTGQAAILFASQGAVRQDIEMPAIVTDNWGVAPFPGGSFVGGSNLFIWHYTRYPRQAVDLLKILTGIEFQSIVPRQILGLPARLDALEANVSTIQKSIIKVLTSGRSYTPLPLWGTVEDRLIVSLQGLAKRFFADPDMDLHTTIEQDMRMLAQRLNITLGQYKSP